jgi:lipopolysaccharide transport system permease protein
MLLALWNYRGFVLASVRREFEARYRASLLGAFWAVANPLAQIAVYTLVLSEVMHARLPGVDTAYAYSIYLCAGIIPWLLFSEIVSRSTNVFVDNGNLLKKLSFPRICLPATVVGSALLNFAIVFGLFVVFLAFTGRLPGAPLLALVPIIAIQVLLASGLGVLLGVANVFYRDTAQGVGIVLQFWFWLTPIVYPLAIVPERFHPVIEANPMTGLIGAYQDVLLKQQWPDWVGLLPALSLGVIVSAIAMRFFRRRSGEMVDEL